MCTLGIRTKCTVLRKRNIEKLQKTNVRGKNFKRYSIEVLKAIQIIHSFSIKDSVQ